MTTRFVADENVPGRLVAALRRRGCDVLFIAETNDGIADGDIMGMLQGTSDVLVTNDKDFGALSLSVVPPAIFGIVLLRFKHRLSDQQIEAIAIALASGTAWRGYFSVMEEDRIRTRPLLPPSLTPR